MKLHTPESSDQDSNPRDGIIGELTEPVEELRGIDLGKIEFYGLDDYTEYFLLLNYLLAIQADLVALGEILSNTEEEVSQESKHHGRIKQLWTDGADLISRVLELLKESNGQGMHDHIEHKDHMYLGVKRLMQEHIRLREFIFAFIYKAKAAEDPDWEQNIKRGHLDAVELSTVKCRVLCDFARDQLARPPYPKHRFSKGSLVYCL